jgi:hypothetical protein
VAFGRSSSLLRNPLTRDAKRERRSFASSVTPRSVSSPRSDIDVRISGQAEIDSGGAGGLE